LEPERDFTFHFDRFGGDVLQLGQSLQVGALSAEVGRAGVEALLLLEGLERVEVIQGAELGLSLLVELLDLPSGEQLVHFHAMVELGILLLGRCRVRGTFATNLPELTDGAGQGHRRVAVVHVSHQDLIQVVLQYFLLPLRVEGSLKDLGVSSNGLQSLLKHDFVLDDPLLVQGKVGVDLLAEAKLPLLLRLPLPSDFLRL